MKKTDKEELSFSRRRMLQATAVVGAASAIGCDPQPTPADAGGGTDAGGETPVDAGPDIIPPTPRTYETFEHGVASGDPLTDAVILWTHVTDGETPSGDPVEVTWEVASDVDFTTIVVSPGWRALVDDAGSKPEPRTMT